MIYKGIPVREGDSLVKTNVEGRKCGEQIGLETLVVHTVNYECCDFMLNLK